RLEWLSRYFEQLSSNYGLSLDYQSSTIEYNLKNHLASFRNGKNQYKRGDFLGISPIITYVPAERNMLSIINTSSFSFIKLDRESVLPQHLLEFGEKYLKQRNINTDFKSVVSGFKIIAQDGIDYLEERNDL